MSLWPNPREASWLATSLALVLAVAIPLLAFFIPFPSSDDDDHPPDHTPIVDLCSWFPAPKAAELVPDHRPPKGQTIFYGEVQCTWQTEAPRTSLELSASRMTTAATTTEDEMRKAREDYAQKNDAIEGKSETVTGLGDEATLTYKTDRDSTQAVVAARDGILVIQVRYSAKTNPATVITRAKEAATELLRVLPPKGH
ncbi:hypothetical protein J4573_09220 [Actinomadura barringtoniae]|uniref:DUF3558 domain-containing protein n=1 Tax=Actinomadura barringtoniae TaxID=1427535 RepID=A0A939T2X5_9ACTN|nr:hypothetical protein [Actinomadura barringtoniae]MBO2447263.1 hypothetical protein [Actinomadura barringtoniae]